MGIGVPLRAQPALDIYRASFFYLAQLGTGVGRPGYDVVPGGLDDGAGVGIDEGVIRGQGEVDHPAVRGFLLADVSNESA